MSNELLNKIVVELVSLKQVINEQMFTKEEARAMHEDIVTTVDRFTKMHEIMGQELVAMRHKTDRLESRLSVAEQKLGIA